MSARGKVRARGCMRKDAILQGGGAGIRAPPYVSKFARENFIAYRSGMSKYFNDPTSVRASTRARIEAAIEQYDYRPNIYAMNQNRQLTKNIGVVVPYLADPFFGEIVRVIERRCIEAGFSPSLFSSHGEAEQERDILDTLRSLKPAAAGAAGAPVRQVGDRGVLPGCAHGPVRQQHRRDGRSLCRV